MQERHEARPQEVTLADIRKNVLEIKLTPQSQLTRAQKCCIVCGRGEPAAMILVALATGGLHMYVYIIYGGIRRQYVFVFFSLAILLWALVAAMLVKYLKLVLRPLKLKHTKTQPKRSHACICVQLYRKARQAKRPKIIHVHTIVETSQFIQQTKDPRSEGWTAWRWTTTVSMYVRSTGPRSADSSDCSRFFDPY